MKIDKTDLTVSPLIFPIFHLMNCLSGQQATNKMFFKSWQIWGVWEQSFALQARLQWKEKKSQFGYLWLKKKTEKKLLLFEDTGKYRIWGRAGFLNNALQTLCKGTSLSSANLATWLTLALIQEKPMLGYKVLKTFFSQLN